MKYFRGFTWKFCSEGFKLWLRLICKHTYELYDSVYYSKIHGSMGAFPGWTKLHWSANLHIYKKIKHIY